MAFEGLSRIPSTFSESPVDSPERLENNDVSPLELRKRRLLNFIQGKIAEVKQSEATAISDSFLGQFESLADSIQNTYDSDPAVIAKKLATYELKLRSYGFSTEQSDAVPVPVVSVEVATPQESIPVRHEIHIQNSAEFLQHKDEVNRVGEFIAAFSKETALWRGTEGAAKKRALGYVRVDLHKWQHVEKELSKLSTPQGVRYQQLASLLQSRYNRLQTNVNLLEVGRLPDISYDVASAQVDTAEINSPQSAEIIENVTATPETTAATSDVSKEEVTPFVLEAKHRVADNERFNTILGELDTLALDDQDRSFVTICIENYHKFQAEGDETKAGSYLHNLEEVLARKRAQEVTGVPHGEMVGRLEVLQRSLDAMAETEEVTTVQTMVDNVRRLIDSNATAADTVAHELKIQQTYQSLEGMYQDLVTPKHEDVTINTPDSHETAPTILVEPEVTPSSFPRIEGVPNPYLRPNEMVATSENDDKKKRWLHYWNRLPRTARAAVIAGLALFANPDTASKQSENFNTPPVVGASLFESSWTTDEAAASAQHVEVSANTEGATRIEVKPYTPQEVEAELMKTSLPDIDDVVSVPTTPDVPMSPEMSGDTVPETDGVKQLEVVPDVLDSNESIIDPKSPEYQEAEAAESTTEIFSSVVKHGEVATYPDNQIDSLFATIDTTGMPDSLVDTLKAQVKNEFYSDREALKAAGFSSGQKDVFYDGEVLNYSEPVQDFQQRVYEYKMMLRTPHTEVAEAGDNLTALILRSYTNDLRVIPESNRAAVVESALATFLEQPNALVDIKLEHQDKVAIGQVVPLSPLARYVAESVSAFVRGSVTANESGQQFESQSPAENVSADDFGDESVVDATVDSPTPLAERTPESYPGGVLAYSQDYNTILESVGIQSAPSSFMDPWFSRGPDNRALLDVTVGQLDVIMNLETPQAILSELTSLGIELDAAEKVYEKVRAARAQGLIPMQRGLAIKTSELLKVMVLNAPNSEK